MLSVQSVQTPICVWLRRYYVSNLGDLRIWAIPVHVQYPALRDCLSFARFNCVPLLLK